MAPATMTSITVNPWSQKAYGTLGTLGMSGRYPLPKWPVKAHAVEEESGLIV